MFHFKKQFICQKLILFIQVWIKHNIIKGYFKTWGNPLVYLLV